MTTILTKKKDTSGVPATADLTNSTGGAELAVNTLDQRLYTKNSSNDIVEVGIKPSTLDIAGAVSAGGVFRITNDVTASGTLNIGSNASVTGTLTGASTVSDQDGDLRDIPKSGSIKTDAYTFAIGDVGNHVVFSSANVNFTVPASTFDEGDIVSVISTNGATATISSGITNMFVAEGVSATATAIIGANGVASILFLSASYAVLTGNVS